MVSSIFSSQQLLTLLFLIYLVAHPAIGDPETQQRIDKICYSVEDYGLCNKIFNDILMGGPADFVGLTKIANEEGLKNASSTLQLIDTLLPSAGQSTPLYIALETCENGYSLVKQAFQLGLFFLNNGDYESMLKSLRIAPRAEGSCDIIFNTPPEKPNPLVERNRVSRILIAMALISGHQLEP